MFMWTCIVTNFFLIKRTDALIFPNLEKLVHLLVLLKTKMPHHCFDSIPCGKWFVSTAVPLRLCVGCTGVTALHFVFGLSNGSQPSACLLQLAFDAQHLRTCIDLLCDAPNHASVQHQTTFLLLLDCLLRCSHQIVSSMLHSIASSLNNTYAHAEHILAELMGIAVIPESQKYPIILNKYSKIWI